ncbi:MAG TPA: TraB/GumN family protein [Sphingomicrobium sp.]|nr:TraB/GumN family protein [Sphingomicrobium sp.]
MAVTLLAAAIAAAMAHASPRPAPAAADSDPAIWVVSDEDTTIFLFGTFHALDGRQAWFNRTVSSALSAADELVLETVVPDRGPGAHAPAGAAPAPTGSFMRATGAVIAAGRSKGLRVDQGADTVLRRVAEASGKPVGGLETLEFQIDLFKRMSAGSPPSQPRVQVQTGADPRLGTLMSQMQDAWKRGEQGLFVVLLNRMRATSPEAYRAMFTERNANWAGWIAQRLQEPGTVFVAVGAGHLAGRDSVQAKLAELGVKSARIN